MVIATQNVTTDLETAADIQYRIAATRKEREAAFHLVYNSYLQAGLGEMNRYKMRITPFHLLPTTEVFIAVHQGEVVLTYTLIMDGELGVPMESVYSLEVDELRQTGVRFAEASCMASRHDLLNGSLLSVFLNVSRLVAQYSRKRDIHRILAAMHPRHARFYRRILGFEQFGVEKRYPCVGYRPAVAMNLDFVRLPFHRPDCQELLFGEVISDRQLEGMPMCEKQRADFESMVDPSLALMPLGEAEELSGSRYSVAAIRIGARHRRLATPPPTPTPSKGQRSSAEYEVPLLAAASGF